MIPEDELKELMEEREEKRIEDLDYQEECKQERSDWDMNDSDYL